MDSFDLKLKNRRKSRVVAVGKVLVGGDNPVSVQSMTNTDTEDVKSTVIQIKKLEDAGADIVRVSCPNKKSTKALKEIIKQVEVPIVADIHFHYQMAIEAAKAYASCLRFNPGNIGSLSAVKEVIKAARDYNCSIRIGVNSGSLEKQLLEKYKEPTADALVESALTNAKILEDLDFFNFKISVKSSNLFMAVNAYTKLAALCDYPLHVGITEAGSLRAGTVLSAMGIGMLLKDGIGDTIRVSLSANPVEEIKVGFDILKSLNLRNRGVKIISCPSCARQGFDVVKTIAEIEEKLSHIKESVVISILGCVVNGIGEASHSDIGIVGVSKDENMVYIDGKKSHTVNNENLINHVVDLVENKVKK
jgi:(E)-4-hydroxy-3-methylbut-2-enyl-diphosphate synthase